MQIGSFIELQFPKGLEYYNGVESIARLNTGRAAIWHAFRVTGAQRIWIPYYQCETVRDFFRKKFVEIKYYHIDNDFCPVDLTPDENDAVLLVNYYGIMSNERMRKLSKSYTKVIIDNSQAFFAEPIENCLNVYSCRKFIGVPDGAYVIGADAEKYTDTYEQGFSSDTSLFLLERIEYGCEGKAYQSRTINEKRIDAEDCLRMSMLTKTILDGTDYVFVINQRKCNFALARELFDSVNLLDLNRLTDKNTVPMVYPLVIENEGVFERLQQAKHFQGRWWKYVELEQPLSSFEYYVSKNMIPITIDQRYGREELEYLRDLIWIELGV